MLNILNFEYELPHEFPNDLRLKTQEIRMKKKI